MIYVHSLGRALRFYPGRTALVRDGLLLTFRELHTRIERIAASLTSQGVGAGDLWLPENSVPSENTEVPIIREIMVATTMSSLFVALFALVVSSFRTRAALEAEIPM